MLNGFEALPAASATGTRGAGFVARATFVDFTLSTASPALSSLDRNMLFIGSPFSAGMITVDCAGSQV